MITALSCIQSVTHGGLLPPCENGWGYATHRYALHENDNINYKQTKKNYCGANTILKLHKSYILYIFFDW